MSGGPGNDTVAAVLTAAIEHELSGLRSSDLRSPASALSARYRSGDVADAPRLATREAQAYLATRLPATFAATRRVLAELVSLRPGWAPESILDLGAGPGTATWAAATLFPSIERAVLVEREPEMAALGARLAEGGLTELLGEAVWAIGDATDVSVREGDLVVAGYVLGELGHDRERAALGKWWRATLGELVLIEPGTPAGFERLRAARDVLIAWGAHVTAPCPNDEACPMEGADWCHFAVRLPRSTLHRDAKGAVLGYEDEKYSYLAVSRHPPERPFARLVRSPRPRSGHVRVWLCETGGMHERVFSRRDGELYRRARATRWGDRLDLTAESS
ncbi:MAG TPA: small ribosomal subunit Rsm22 family protein [Acidimicrobiales bacterium]|nr:small ribosomal subunit Rsm22 family protein [Acidimicrobiales bacterium]